MTKRSGLGDNFYIGGYDLSGDVGAVNTIADRTGLLDATGIDKSGRERMSGLASGEISFNSFFNDAAGQAHEALKGLVKTDRIAMWLKGDPAVPPVAISSSSVASPTVITTATDHGLTTGDTVLITGHTGSTPDINGYHTATVTAATTFTIPVNVTVGGTGGTVTLVFTSGKQSASMVAKQINYDPARTADMGLIATVQCLSNPDSASERGTGLQFTRAITAGKRHDTSATNGVGVDDGAQADPVTITSSSVANPTVITTAAAHGLTTGDIIVIAGHSGSTPDINGIWTVTVLTSVTFTIPVEVTTGGTGGTSTLISTRYGLSAYLQVFAFTGPSVTVTFKESSDDGVTDAYAAVTGGAFTAVTSAPGQEFIETSRTLVVERWLRVDTSGTFTVATFAVTYFRYKA